MSLKLKVSIFFGILCTLIWVLFFSDEQKIGSTDVDNLKQRLSSIEKQVELKDEIIYAIRREQNEINEITSKLSSNITENQKDQEWVMASEKPTSPTTQEGLSLRLTLLLTLSSGLLGALIATGISIYHSKRIARQEYRSLILVFCSEMVSIYSRCVKYYRQSKSRGISYSALFSFTDASALSKFASVCKQPSVVAAIMDLKSMYFQIQRHVDEASRFAVEGNRTELSDEKINIMKKAAIAQGTALAFFHSSYEDIEKGMDLLIKVTKEVSPGDVANNLYLKYSDAKTDKKKIDKEIEDEKKKTDGGHNNLML